MRWLWVELQYNTSAQVTSIKKRSSSDHDQVLCFKFQIVSADYARRFAAHQHIMKNVWEITLQQNSDISLAGNWDKTGFFMVVLKLVLFSSRRMQQRKTIKCWSPSLWGEKKLTLFLAPAMFSICVAAEAAAAAELIHDSSHWSNSTVAQTALSMTEVAQEERAQSWQNGRWFKSQDCGTSPWARLLSPNRSSLCLDWIWCHL